MTAEAVGDSSMLLVYQESMDLIERMLARLEALGQKLAGQVGGDVTKHLGHASQSLEEMLSALESEAKEELWDDYIDKRKRLKLAPQTTK